MQCRNGWRSAAGEQMEETDAGVQHGRRLTARMQRGTGWDIGCGSESLDAMIHGLGDFSVGRDGTLTEGKDMMGH